LQYGRGYLASLAPTAILFGGGDDIYFPLLYAKYVEGRRPDVLLFSYIDTMFPGRERLFTRLADHGLRTRPITCRARHPVGNKLHYCFLRGLLAENVDRRPVYLVGLQDSLTRPRLRDTLAPYARIQVTNLPG